MINDYLLQGIKNQDDLILTFDTLALSSTIERTQW